MTTLSIQSTRVTILLTSALLLTLSTPVQANWFDMDDLFSSMEEQMKQMRKEMEHMQSAMQHCVPHKKGKSVRSAIKQDDQAQAVIVTLNNITAESVDAQLDEQTGILQLSADNLNAKIVCKANTIALEISEKREMKKTPHKDTDTHDAQAKDCWYSATHNRAYIKEYVSTPVSITNATINYDADTAIVTITIPYAQQKSTHKKLPVTLTKPSKEKKSTEK